jgi:hypothetical protein
MATLVKKTSATEPDVITVQTYNGEYIYVAININVRKKTDELYEYDAIVLPEFALNNIHKADYNTKYSVLVSHIIKAYYNDNQAMAIMANYLSDMQNEQYAAEFIEYQRIRKVAKTTAKEITQRNLF